MQQDVTNPHTHVLRRSRLWLVLMLLCIVGQLPSTVSALTIDGCELTVGATCNVSPVQFYVQEVNGSTEDARVGDPFAKVRVSITAFSEQDFEYRYQVFDQQFVVTNFLLDLTLIAPPAIVGSGSTLDSDPTTIAPTVAGFDPGSGFFSAVFLTPSIAPSAAGSDWMFVRSTLAPNEVPGIAGGSSSLDALYGAAVLQGPGGGLGSSITGSAQTPVPDPATWLLVGSGLLGLAAHSRRPRP